MKNIKSQPRHMGIVVVMQRLHAEDLTGHLLEKGGWEQLCLPAESEREIRYHYGGVEYLRQAGELLHPAREDAAQLAVAKRELGSMAYAAQYQQNPVPAGAGMVRREWFGRYRQAGDGFERVVQSWDTAIKATSQHDASVCVTVGERDNNAYVLDVAVVRMEYPALKRFVCTQARQWQADVVLLEDKASGQSLLQDLRGAAGMPPLIGVMPAQDKVTRFAAVTAVIEAGEVWLPHEAVWLAEFEGELLAFPQGRHDDQVDALSQYLNWRRGKKKGGFHIRPL